nr:hypothetical protein [uncultured Roseobacter sp.]
MKRPGDKQGAHRFMGPFPQMVWKKRHHGQQNKDQQAIQAELAKGFRNVVHDRVRAGAGHICINGVMQQQCRHCGHARPFVNDVNAVKAGEKCFNDRQSGRHDLPPCHQDKCQKPQVLTEKRKRVGRGGQCSELPGGHQCGTGQGQQSGRFHIFVLRFLCAGRRRPDHH